MMFIQMAVDGLKSTDNPINQKVLISFILQNIINYKLLDMI